MKISFSEEYNAFILCTNCSRNRSDVQMWLGPGSSNDITIGKEIDP